MGCRLLELATETESSVLSVSGIGEMVVVKIRQKKGL